jgi:hypothetical protein
METTTADPREPYEAPVIEDIPIRPDEMVLAGCKTNAGPTALGNFVACGIPTSCKTTSLS